MRKIMLALAILAAVFWQAVPAMAEEVSQIIITASSTEVKPGEEITFTVTVDGAQSCRYYGLMLEYDASVYEMGSGKCTVTGAMLSAFDPERGFVVLNSSEQIPQGTLGTFTMKVREDAPAGNAAVAGISSMKTGDEAIPSEVIGANVEIRDSAAPSVPQTTAPGQTGSSGSSGSQTSGQPAKPAYEKPSFVEPDSTAAAQTVPQLLPAGSEPAVQEQETRPAAAEAEAQQTLQPENPQEEPKPGLLPWICGGAAALCVLVLLVWVIRKRKR